jgi:hypothetical protein
MGVGAQIVSLLLGYAQLKAPSGGGVYSAPAAFQLAIGFVAVTSAIALILAIAVPRQRLDTVEEAAP